MTNEEIDVLVQACKAVASSNDHEDGGTTIPYVRGSMQLLAEIAKRLPESGALLPLIGELPKPGGPRTVRISIESSDGYQSWESQKEWKLPPAIAKDLHAAFDIFKSGVVGILARGPDA